MKIQVLKVRIHKDFLEKDQDNVNDFVALHEVKSVDTAFVQEEYYWSVIIYYKDVLRTQPTPQTTLLNESRNQKYSAEGEFLSPDEIVILESLKEWRSEKAKDQNIPSYCIASNKELTSVAKYKPAKKEELLSIKGFGKHKIENYGSEILEILDNV